MEYPIDALKRIIAKWPKAKEEINAEVKARFIGDITQDFDFSCLTTAATEEYSMFSEELIVHQGNEARILVYDSGRPTYPHLAILIRDKDNKWLLKSFLGQCFTCGGWCIINREICDVCGGEGWGLVIY